MGELARGDAAVAGELVSPALELVEEFVLTLGEGAKVAKTALLNAASVAGLALTTDVLLTDLKEDAELIAGAVV